MDANGSTPSRSQKNGHYVGDSYDFEAKNLTAYGGLLPVATMLEKLGFQQLVEETLTVNRVTRAMPMYQFVLAIVLAVYVGFSRLHHLRFLSREPMLTGILKVLRLPPQCTFWRFLASLHLGVARQLLEVQRRMRERVWEAAHVELTVVTLDTALQEFSVQTSNMSPEHGISSTGAVNVVTKSGTNQIHGDAFWFVRNTALNATNFFSQQQDDLLLEAFRPKTEYHGNVVKHLTG